METFTPTLDWGNELWTSLWWIAQGWAYAAVATIVVLALIVRFTTWGRQFWRVTRGYFTGPESLIVWLWLAVILLLVILSVRLSVLFSFQGNDMMTSFQVIASGVGAGDDAVKQSGGDGFWMSMGVFAVLAVINVVSIMVDLLLTQRFMLRWRTWLTDRLTGDWLDGKAYYRSRFIDDTIDNPDQRIQADIDIFTAGVGPLPNMPNNTSGSTLLFGAVSSIAAMISFTTILWNLSGPVTLPFVGFELPKAMFVIGIVYILFATVVAFVIGRPIITLSFNNEKFNAAFRYALVRLRDAAEAVAFYRGEIAERTGLRRRFGPIVENYKKYVNRMAGFLGWNLSISQAQELIPYIVQFPRFFSGEITLGQLSQTAGAFREILTGLSFFRNAYDQFAGYRAAIIRLHGLVVANEEGRELPTLTVEPSSGNTVELDDVEVRKPDGTQLIDPIDLRLEAGDTLAVTGVSGTGKTTLLRSLAQLWPYTTGTLRCPQGTNETMFLSQLPYVPLGDLRAVLSYPRQVGDIPDSELVAVLNKVALPHLVSRLDEEQDWAKVLSPGEQQRVAFARILLTRPKAAFFDEATSALDVGLETMLYQMVRDELPDTILVSVAHRGTVIRQCEKELALLGDGRWRLGLAGADAP
ncbi:MULTISPECIES: ABC transporter ATP-binding protein/permease [Mycolicibacterium]|jgi:putative ATP-binding cassette transporter|uniref:ABC transporter domain protein n=2 Tax=Mycolicibacterium TaxID=1866885 RepID=A1T9W6_MYCVP|nr:MULTISPECIES: ABC transporter ATP-binding protein/permease [Mycolicibacterium]ABM13966.1 ABC transporter domain protein [Mycolicibacterium vanbaalenii PYR-1]MCV7129547.1 ABC transporter ATP-binding protein/permease [Mycolicibacterium vanbaalenii PYR-1]MDN4518694.1 ABC transporter ATP-binding protein/permease [Mycolicibacterium austroafricanum]PQP46014.1 ABC transporter ATP-binding protein/permease [Mycolicibacterium austroafricanum]QRZ04379.1 ABC transporter ATP-binding protein/permease [My